MIEVLKGNIKVVAVNPFWSQRLQGDLENSGVFPLEKYVKTY